MKRKLNILIVEDSKVFAQGLQLLLKQYLLSEDIFLANDFEATFKILRMQPIHLIFLDLNFDTKSYDGFIIANKIKQLYPTIKILILTQHAKKEHHQRLFEECKVDAYLDKQLGIEEIVLAIEIVIKGEKYIDQHMKQMLEIEDWMICSKREQEVILLVMKGLTQKEVAEILFISPKTIETHIKNLMQRFGVKNTTELVAKYILYKNANRENPNETTSPFKSIV